MQSDQNWPTVLPLTISCIDQLSKKKKKGYMISNSYRVTIIAKNSMNSCFQNEARVTRLHSFIVVALFWKIQLLV